VEGIGEERASAWEKRGEGKMEERWHVLDLGGACGVMVEARELWLCLFIGGRNWFAPARYFLAMPRLRKRHTTFSA
jgi:hypothetical protein